MNYSIRLLLSFVAPITCFAAAHANDSDKPVVGIVTYGNDANSQSSPVWTGGKPLTVTKNTSYRIEAGGMAGTIPDAMRELRIEIVGSMYCTALVDGATVLGAGPFAIYVLKPGVVKDHGNFSSLDAEYRITDSFFRDFHCPAQAGAPKAVFAPDNSLVTAKIMATSNAGQTNKGQGGEFKWSSYNK